MALYFRIKNKNSNVIHVIQRSFGQTTLPDRTLCSKSIPMNSEPTIDEATCKNCRKHIVFSWLGSNQRPDTIYTQ